jgi:hypothetical protein
MWRIFERRGKICFRTAAAGLFALAQLYDSPNSMKNEVRKAAEGKVVTLYFALNLSGCF